MALTASQRTAAQKTLAKAKSQLQQIQRTKDSLSKSGGFTEKGLSKATSSLKAVNDKASSVRTRINQPITPEAMTQDPGVATMPKPPAPTVPGLDLENLLNTNNNLLASPQDGLTVKDNQFAYDPTKSEGVNAAMEANAGNASVLQAVANYLKPQANQFENAYKDLERQSGVRGYQKDVDRYSRELNAITAARDANILKLEGQGRGITDVIIGGQQARINRDAAIQALPVQAQLAAAQGSLEAAQKHLDTLFQVRSQDIQATTAYKTNLANSVMQYASNAQQSILNAKLADIQTKQQTATANLNYQRQLQMQALEYGQTGLLQSIAGLDPKSATFEQDIARYTSQLRKPVAATAAKAPDLQNFGTSDNPVWKEFNPSTGQWQDVSGLEGATNPKQAASLVQATKQLDTLNAITNSKAVDSTVGTSFLTRAGKGFFNTLGRVASVVGIPTVLGGAKDNLTGDRQQLIADVQNMVTNLSFDKLIQTKAQGATYGSLTEGEWKKIDAAATKLGSWAVNDSEGNPISYNTSEKNFLKEVDTIKYYTKLDYVLKGGDPALVGAIQQEDGTYWVQNSDGTYSQLQLEY